MPTKLHAAVSLAGLGRTSTACVESTVAGSYDSAFVASSIALPIGPNSSSAATGSLVTPAFSAQTTYWLHGEFYSTSGAHPAFGSIGPWIELLNASGTVVFRIRASGSGNLTMTAEYWNGSAFVASGSTFGNPTWTTRIRVDLKVICGASGSWVLYLNGTAGPSGSIASASMDNVAQARLSNTSNAVGYWSQVAGADYDIRDTRLMGAALNGNSASNTGAASGAYTDVNEAPLDESTSISITTSANKAGLTHAAITVPSGYVIGAAVVTARGRATGSITDGKLGIRTTSTGNTSSTGRTYNGGYEPRSYIVENNPDTATRFTQSEFNATEIYLEAA